LCWLLNETSVDGGYLRRPMKSIKASLLTRIVAALICAVSINVAHAADADKPELLVFAAASLTNVLEELGKAYQATSGQAVKFSFASSSTLARQVEASAKADIFVAADTDWVDYLQNHNLIKADTRLNLLGNRLVLIAPSDSQVQLKIAANFALATALGKRRLSIGDPDSGQLASTHARRRLHWAYGTASPTNCC